MIKPELKTLTPIQPGFALLLLKGWKGDAEGVTISVVRNQDRLYLDSHGDWVSGEIFLALPPLIQNEETPCVQVGPSLIDPLLANRQAAYRITIKDGSNKDMGILTIAEGLLSSQAGGENPLPENIQTLNDTPIVQPMSVQEPEPVVLEPVAEKPVSQLPQKPKSKLPLFAGLAILLLLLAAAGWWFTRKPEPAIPAAPPAPVAKITGPCGDEQMASGNEMAFVKGCLRSQPSSAQLLDVIAKAKAAKHCDIAQRLYAYKAQSGDTQMAVRYAQEYDPKTAKPGGCFNPDAETAAYWYESVVNQDPQNNEAKARLAELKK